LVRVSSLADLLNGTSGFCLYRADCRQALRDIPDHFVDSVGTDSPYEIDFLKKGWDRTGVSYDVGLWKEVRRVTKPGGYLLAFAATRTAHRVVCAIEDAGWEIRDQLGWLYSTGFTKVGYIRDRDGSCVAPGWGGSLKPAMELICLARKPCEGTVAQNLAKYGTGALHIDPCRVELPPGDPLHKGVRHKRRKLDTKGRGYGFVALDRQPGLARWPANVLHDQSEEVLETLAAYGATGAFFQSCPFDREDAALVRIFYSGKASPRDRNEGLAGLRPATRRVNDHPTVKPTGLFRYLLRLVTPPGGITLDPFLGSGSSGKAAMLENLRFLGIEIDPGYFRIAHARIEHARAISTGRATTIS
jgi:site-specific DNA-methyltransferase (adenine-specific)